jgi:hypothetical protein
MQMDDKRTGPGAWAAILAFAVFVLIVAGSVVLAQRNIQVKTEFGPARDFRESADGSKVEMVTVMRANIRKSETKTFRDGEMVTIAGNSMIDLTGAQMAGEKGRLEVVVLGGRAHVRVPNEWAVETEDSVTVGALSNRASKAISEPAKKLRLEAVILGGRLDVTH